MKNALPGTEIGTKHVLGSNPGAENGTNGPLGSNLRAENGTNGLLGSNLQAGSGTNGLLGSNLRAANHGNGTNREPLAAIQASPENILTLTHRIKARKLLLLSKKKGAKVVKLLIHLNNKEAATTQAMRQVSGYTKSSLAKALMSLRKKGMVIRHGVRNYELSAKAQELMHELQ
jgi:hypothetical protein